jgi:hypothetical protein
MTIRTNARVAGVTFLVYIAAGVSSLAMSGRTHVTDLLMLVTSLSALTLGVTLYAITRQVDPDLAMLAMMCRVVEAIPGDGARNAIFFAAGSTLFCWLLLRGRLIPVALAWLGVLASALLVAILVVQRAGLLGGGNWYSSVTWLIWLPMLVFELTFAGWLIVKGVNDENGRLPDVRIA